MMQDQPPISSPTSATPFDAFCALVLVDHSLQQQLLQPDFTDEEKFITRLADIARQRGFAIAPEDVRQAMRPRLPGLEGLVDSSVDETPPPPPDGWLPIRVSAHRGAFHVHWAYFGARRLRQPFFQGEVQDCAWQPPNRLFRYVTPIEKLAAWLDARPHLQPSGFIFHMSRCGSTLVSQMLAALPSNLVVSEASPIDSVVQASQFWPDLDAQRHAAWLNAIVGAFGQQRHGGERRYFVKLDCWHTLALPLFRRAFPAVPWVFLYRDPVEVLASQISQPGTQMLPSGIGPNLYGIERSYGPGTAEDYYARVLAKVCEPVLRHYGEGGGLLVNYRELPEALFSAILPHFGVTGDEADRAAMIEATRYDAKSPGMAFTPDSEAKQRGASAATRAAAERWLCDPYRRLEALRAAGTG
jgi:hypothetical protein